MQRFLKTLMAVGVLVAGSMATQAAMQHRYSFDTDASDSVGSADGTLVGTTGSFAGGMVEFPGDTRDAHVSLPGATIAVNTYSALTVESWFRWDALPGDWQKLFSFGDTQTVNTWAGMEYLSSSLRQGGAGPCDAEISDAPDGDGDPWTEAVNVAGPILDTGDHYIAVTVDDTYIEIYVDGVMARRNLLANGTTIPMLSELSNAKVLIGESVYPGDADMGGAVDEFRIHNSVLGDVDIAVNAQFGPDDPNGTAGTETSRTLIVGDLVADGAFQASLEVTFANLLNPVQIQQDDELVWESSDTDVVTVSETGMLTGVAPGTVTITATYKGTPSTEQVTVEGTTLVHRYAFDGANDSSPSFTEPDLVGTADGTVYNGARQGDGMLSLVATASAYVDLPNGIMSALSSATIEAWVTPSAGDEGWARIADFGTTDIGEVLPDNTNTFNGGASWLYLSAKRGADDYVVAFASNPGPATIGVSYVPGTEMHVVATYNSASGEMTLYMDGQEIFSGTGAPALSALDDVNNWLGRSMFSGDAYYTGLYNEFRIYEGILGSRQIGINNQLGPNVVEGDPGAVSGVEVVADDTLVIDSRKRAGVGVSYASLSEPVEFSADSDLAWSSSDTNIVTIADDGVMTAVSTGTVTITANYDGTEATQAVTVTDVAIVHRYSFNGAADFDFLGDGFVEPDLVGTNDATAYYLERLGDGTMWFDTTLSGFMDMDNGIISTLGSATFEAYLTVNDFGGGWQRIWSFGTSTDGEIDQYTLGGFWGDVGPGPMFLTARVGATPSIRFDHGGSPPFVQGPENYGFDTPIHVVMTYNTAGEMSDLYFNGVPVGSDQGATPLLDDLPDVNVWLGRSQWSADAYLDAYFDEFRIYEGTLTPEEVAVNYATGPNGEPFTDPGDTVTSIALAADRTELIADVDQEQTTAYADFTNVSDVPVNGFDGVVFSSSDTNVITVSDSGVVSAVGAGVADAWVAYAGVSNSLQFAVTAIVKPVTVVHHWMFNDADGQTTAMDSVGTAHGAVIGANHMFTGTTLDLFGGGTSETALDPASGSHVDLPNGIISALPGAATFEVWYVADDVAASWQRVLDVGASDSGIEGTPGLGADNLFITPRSGDNTIRSAIATNSPGYSFEQSWNGPAPVGGELTHVVFTYDSDDSIARLFVNGVSVESSDAKHVPPFALANLNDINNWLGRAQYGGDPLFNGQLHDLRIYTGIMTSSEVAAGYAAGPPGDAPAVGPTLGAAQSGTDLILTWQDDTDTFGVETADGMQDGENTVWTDAGVTPVDDNGAKTATIPMDAGEGYFRLTD